MVSAGISYCVKAVPMDERQWESEWRTTGNFLASFKEPRGVISTASKGSLGKNPS